MRLRRSDGDLGLAVQRQGIYGSDAPFKAGRAEIHTHRMQPVAIVVTHEIRAALSRNEVKWRESSISLSLASRWSRIDKMASWHDAHAFWPRNILRLTLLTADDRANMAYSAMPYAATFD